MRTVRLGAWKSRHGHGARNFREPPENFPLPMYESLARTSTYRFRSDYPGSPGPSARVSEPPPRPAETAPQVVVLAGPNGAGKSTAAVELLGDMLHVSSFVNADQIARGLSGFAPERAAVSAGRIMLERMGSLLMARSDFAFETTLSGRSVRTLLGRCTAAGYEIHVLYLWLAGPELAVQRVRARVAKGGHDIPEVDIRRRFTRGLLHFVDIDRQTVTSWRVLDANAPHGNALVAYGRAGGAPVVLDDNGWAAILRQAAMLRDSGDTHDH
ncbi:MAG: AAA family ATPase [Gemmatimonadaceae bacterium]